MRKKAERSVNELNFNGLVDRNNFSLTVSSHENPCETEARIRMQEEEAAHQRRKDLMLFRFAIALFTVLVTLCSWAIISAAPYADKAMIILMSLATGLAGYLFGKSSSHK